MDSAELLMVLASAGLHAVWSSSIKGSHDPLAFNALLTALSAALGVGVIGFVGVSQIPTALWLGAALTGVPHGLYLLFLSRAFERGDLSLVYPIVRSTPAFLPLVAVPLLGESLSLAGVAGIAVVVVGIWLVQSDGVPGLRALRTPGAGHAALALAATVVYSLLDKHNMGVFSAAPWSAPVPRSVVYFFLLYMAAALVFLPLARRQRGPGALVATARREGGRAVLAVGAGLAGYGLILEAFRSAPASYVVAVRQASVVFALAIAVGLLGERPGPARLLGALATAVGVALIALAP